MFGNVFERRESKYCAVLVKYRLKGKGEQVIILQMAQQLKIYGMKEKVNDFVRLYETM